MEEWIGRQWDRVIRRWARREHTQAAVTLVSQQHIVSLLYRALGGAPTVRVTAASERTVGGWRDWVQRVAGSGTRAALPQLDAAVLALPPLVARHQQAELNRGLYLWWGVLAAHMTPSGAWVADNVAATARVLHAYPGLEGLYRRLLEAEFRDRPPSQRLRGRARAAEEIVRQALQGVVSPQAHRVRPEDVAPVWLWIDTRGAVPLTVPAGPMDASVDMSAAAGERKAHRDDRRRRASAIEAQRPQAPLVMFFRAESILSWAEFVHVNRAEDDELELDARQAADDMDVLALARDGARTASRVKFDLDLPSAAADDEPLQGDIRLPEWDWRQQRLLPDHCVVQLLRPQVSEPWVPSPALRATARRVRRRMEVICSAWGRQRAQRDGDELDLDAWVRQWTEPHARVEDPAVHVRRVRNTRSLATLLLADLSQSTDAYVDDYTRVIDVIRDALYVFGEALGATGDPFAMLGFSSVRRQHVRIHQLKGFAETWSPAVVQRVGAVRPGFYTRMGAAIRYGVSELQRQPQRQRLLLLLTDGKPNDLDAYEGRYGLEDTRQAILAVRRAGVVPFCITIDEMAHEYLPRLFGSQGYVWVRQAHALPTRLVTVYQQLMAGAGR